MQISYLAYFNNIVQIITFDTNAVFMWQQFALQISIWIPLNFYFGYHQLRVEMQYVK